MHNMLYVDADLSCVDLDRALVLRLSTDKTMRL